MIINHSIMDHNEAHHDSQICRTCAHRTNRFHLLDTSTVVTIRARGEDPADHQCQPEDHAVTQLLLADGAVVPYGTNTGQTSTTRVLGSDGTPVEITLRHPERATVGTIDSCGYLQANKCQRCTRFRPVEARTSYVDETGQNRFRTVAIGGHCSIPPEGIEVGGKISHCDPKPMGMKIEPSCANCAFVYHVGPNDFIDDHHTVSHIDLDPYEMHQARETAKRTDTSIGMAIGRARMRKNQSWYGRWRTYKATILSAETRDITKKVGIHRYSKIDDRPLITTTETLAYTVRFERSGAVDTFRVDDPEYWYNVTLIDDTTVAIEIKLPHQAKYGFTDQTSPMSDGARRSYRVFPPLPSKVNLSPPDHSRGTDPDCPRCSPTRACYFHTKAPVYSVMTGTVSFSASAPEAPHWNTRLNPEWMLSVHNHEGRWRIVNGHGSTPHPTVLSTQINSLARQTYHRHGAKARLDIVSQWASIVHSLPLASRKSVAINLDRPSSLEAYRSYCSLNLHEPDKGYDFRALFGDRFGLVATSKEFSEGWTHRMSVEEQFRANGPGARLHEHLLSLADEYETGRDKVREVPVTISSTKRHIALDVFGTVIDDEGDLPTDFAAADIAAYMEWLNSEVIVNIDGKPIRTDRRWTAHGYRNYRPSRAEDMPATHINSDGDDITGQWLCVECNTTVRPDELDGAPICSCGGELIMASSRAETATIGPRVGIGNALFPNSDSFQATQRLRETVCPNWQWNLAKYRPIGLDQVIPNAIHDADGAPVVTEAPIARIIERVIADVVEYEIRGIDYSFVRGTTLG